MIAEELLGATVFGGTPAPKRGTARPSSHISDVAKVGLPLLRYGERHAALVRAEEPARDDALPALSAVKLPGHVLDAHGCGSAVIADSVDSMNFLHGCFCMALYARLAWL
eukprot:7148327-Prymnesium_polylepis.1